MRIVAVNGSYRGDKGFTRFLIDKLFEGARQAGADCDCITLVNHQVNLCRGCFACQGKARFLNCVHTGSDDAAALFARMAAADAIVYATPVYVFGMSPALKTLIDRILGISDCSNFFITRRGLFFHSVNDIAYKPFASIVCCDNFESATPANVLHYFRTFARFHDAPYVGSLVRNCGFLVDHGANPEKERLVPRIHQVYAAYVQAGRELATRGRISRGVQRRANQELLPLPLAGVLKRLLPVKRRILRAVTTQLQQMASEGPRSRER